MPVTILYKNWKGETGLRRIQPIKIWYGHTDFHPEFQLFLKAIDLDKNAERDFAIKDILKMEGDIECLTRNL